jgi:ribonuclease PH
MNVVMTGAGRLVETQATAEGRTFSVEDLNHLIELARPAINYLVEVQKSILNLVINAK